MSQEAKYIIFDLETTSLSKESEIVQIAARECGKERSFSAFLMPEGAISAGASRVTGLKTVGSRPETKKLLHHGKPVQALSQQEGMRQFSTFLGNTGSSVVLVAHNCHAFDMMVLLNTISKLKLEEHFRFVEGFADTLPAFQASCLDQPSYSLPKLHGAILGSEFCAHDAVEDALALDRLMKELKPNLVANSITAESAVALAQYQAGKSHGLLTLQSLVADGIVSKGMAEKIAASGLALRHLLLAARRDAENGIKCLFREKINGRFRITNLKGIIVSVQEKALAILSQ